MELHGDNIGIFGGSFNPVHIGHMMLAQYIAEFAGLDKVLLMLSPHNPLKENSSLAPDNDRMQMLSIATSGGYSRVEPSDIELHLPRPSYTAMTLRELKSRYPATTFHLIIGADNWLSFDRWREPDFILANAKIIIYPRPGYDIDPVSLPAGVRLMEGVPTTEISSSFIRRAIAGGHDMNYFMPHNVYKYIIEKGLYI